MKTLSFTHPYNADVLLPQLDAVADLAPLPNEGIPGARVAVYQFLPTGPDAFTVRVPDDADEAAIQAVVDAHDATSAAPAHVAPLDAASSVLSAINSLDPATATVADVIGAVRSALGDAPTNPEETS